MEDKLVLGGKEFKSRFILGSGKYNLNLIKAAVKQGGAEIITLALRRANTQESENILDFIPKGVMLGGFSVKRMLNLMGTAGGGKQFTKEELLELNRKLNKIKRKDK